MIQMPKTVVREFDEALKLVLYLSKRIAELEKSRPAILKSELSEQDKFYRVDEVDAELKTRQDERVDVLRQLVDFPPYFKQYEPLIKKLAQRVERTFEERVKNKFEVGGRLFEVGGRLRCKGSVFVMTKYPDGENPQRDEELQTLLGIVESSISDCGFEPLLANQTSVHANLWENVECHMLTCSHGVAIVESKFKSDLNPNVAMEWGWMRAMRKPVLWLIEKDANAVPVDVAGLIRARFDWLNPQADIPTLIKNYFQEQ
jgi:hypothetical protein